MAKKTKPAKTYDTSFDFGANTAPKRAKAKGKGGKGVGGS